MKVLLTNDDGYQAKGIKEMAKILLNIPYIKKVYVLAPNIEMSSKSHFLSVFHPIFVEKIKENKKIEIYRSNGSPADCTKIGVLSHFFPKPDLVISGINIGANLGYDVFYSGTIAAAREALFHKIPSMAFSINSYDKHCNFDYVKKYLKKIIIFGIKNFKKNLLIFNKNPYMFNINIPYLEKIKGIKITKVSKSSFQKKVYHAYIEKDISKKKNYFWISEIRKPGKKSNSDLKAIQNAYISISPLTIETTNFKIYKQIKKNI